MFDTRIFNPERLGSEEEEKSLQYTGFTILAHVNAENSAQAIQWAKCTFSGGGYEFDEKDNRYFIHCNLCDSPIEVIPQKIKYKDAYDLKAQTFNLIFQSDIFGYKWYEENHHQELCRNVLSKIRKKRGFWVRGGKTVSHTENAKASKTEKTLTIPRYIAKVTTSPDAHHTKEISQSP